MPMPNQARLDAVRARRESLHQAMIGLEDALSTPVNDGEHWRLRMTMAVDHAANRITEHISDAEGDDGLLDQISDEAPRLTCDVDKLRVEHGQLTGDLENLRQALDEFDPDEVQDENAPTHQAALDLLGLVGRHRRRGADLIYEAYHVDIGDSH